MVNLCYGDLNSVNHPLTLIITLETFYQSDVYHWTRSCIIMSRDLRENILYVSHVNKKRIKFRCDRKERDNKNWKIYKSAGKTIKTAVKENQVR